MGSHLGLPDAGLASYRDMVERAPQRRMAGGWPAEGFTFFPQALGKLGVLLKGSPFLEGFEVHHKGFHMFVFLNRRKSLH